MDLNGTVTISLKDYHKLTEEYPKAAINPVRSSKSTNSAVAGLMTPFMYKFTACSSRSSFAISRLT